MIVDEKGNPLTPKPTKLSVFFSRIKSWGKKGPTAIALLVAITALIVNLDSVVNLYERFTKGPSFHITVKVENDTDAPIEIEPLLDFYITRSQFHTGRLMAGEAPTGRIMLKLINGTNENSIYRVEPKNYKLFDAEFRQRPYKSELASGGSSIVFVLRIQGSSRLYWLQQAFQSDVIEKTLLKIEVK